MALVRILGVDPGLRHTGWGVIEAEGSRLAFVAAGAVHSRTGGDLASRLRTAGLGRFLRRHGCGRHCLRSRAVDLLGSPRAGRQLRLARAKVAWHR